MLRWCSRLPGGEAALPAFWRYLRKRLQIPPSPPTGTGRSDRGNRSASSVRVIVGGPVTTRRQTSLRGDGSVRALLSRSGRGSCRSPASDSATTKAAALRSSTSAQRMPQISASHRPIRDRRRGECSRSPPSPHARRHGPPRRSRDISTEVTASSPTRLPRRPGRGAAQGHRPDDRPVRRAVRSRAGLVVRCGGQRVPALPSRCAGRCAGPGPFRLRSRARTRQAPPGVRVPSGSLTSVQ